MVINAIDKEKTFHNSAMEGLFFKALYIDALGLSDDHSASAAPIIARLYATTDLASTLYGRLPSAFK